MRRHARALGWHGGWIRFENPRCVRWVFVPQPSGRGGATAASSTLASVCIHSPIAYERPRQTDAPLGYALYSRFAIQTRCARPRTGGDARRARGTGRRARGHSLCRVVTPRFRRAWPRQRDAGRGTVMAVARGVPGPSPLKLPQATLWLRPRLVPGRYLSYHQGPRAGCYSPAGK